jgi:hypothetical protein
MTFLIMQFLYYLLSFMSKCSPQQFLLRSTRLHGATFWETALTFELFSFLRIWAKIRYKEISSILTVDRTILIKFLESGFCVAKC